MFIKYYFPNNSAKRRTIMKVKPLALSIATLALLLSSCSKGNNQNGNTITDLGGDTVVLPQKLDRIVSTSEPCTDFLVSLGLGDKLVGCYYRTLNNPWFKEVYPNHASIEPLQSYTPEAESLIALGTDVIFVPSQERAVELRNKGIVAITIRFYTPKEVEDSVKLLGNIFGGEVKEKGNEWLADWRQAKEQIAEKITDIAENEKPVVYEVLADKGRGPFRTYYGENQAWLSYAGGILATKDFANATSQEMPTEEAILATNPDVIFIGGIYATKEYNDLLVNEKWTNINAIKNDRVYIEPIGPMAWNACSVCYTVLIYYCFSYLYPEKVDFNLKTMAHDYYLKYYNKDFTNSEIDLMFASKAPTGEELY